jgi:hypothetical protein
MVIFCQLDVTGRTENEPVAETLVRNLLQYVSAWKPAPRRQAVYVGEPAGRDHLESIGVSPGSYESGNLPPGGVLVAGPGCSQKLAGKKAAIVDWLKAGGNILAIGLDQPDADAMLPLKVSMKKAEHISAFFEPSGMNSLLRGVGPADVHNRDPKEISLVSRASRPRTEGGTPSAQRGQDGRDTAQAIGDGVLARAEGANVVFCQLVPWQFTHNEQANLRRTARRTSFLVSRLLANMQVAGSTPLLERFSKPVGADESQGRWLDGFYLDEPQEWDDPYRFFRW